MTREERKQKAKAANRATREVHLDAIKRRAAVVPSGKQYRRKPKHRGQGWS